MEPDFPVCILSAHLNLKQRASISEGPCDFLNTALFLVAAQTKISWQLSKGERILTRTICGLNITVVIGLLKHNYETIKIDALKYVYL